MPMRNSMRLSAAMPVSRSGIACCTSTAQRTASTTLANSTSIPSPVVLTMRPWCSAICGSRSSRRSALRCSSVPSSSAPISREYPATSAARIAARRRLAGTAASSLRKDGPQLLYQLGGSFGDSGPEDVPIDVEIGVHQPISHSNDRTPWQVGQLSAGIGGDLVRGSPAISTARTSANRSISSESRSARSRSRTERIAEFSASARCCNRIRSRGFILHLGLGKHLVATIAAQILDRAQIHPPSRKQGRQVLLDLCEVQETRLGFGREFDQQVDIAIRLLLSPQSRAEEPQAADLAPPAQ